MEFLYLLEENTCRICQGINLHNSTHSFVWCNLPYTKLETRPFSHQQNQIIDWNNHVCEALVILVSFNHIKQCVVRLILLVKSIPGE